MSCVLFLCLLLKCFHIKCWNICYKVSSLRWKWWVAELFIMRCAHVFCHVQHRYCTFYWNVFSARYFYYDLKYACIVEVWGRLHVYDSVLNICITGSVPFRPSLTRSSVLRDATRNIKFCHMCLPKFWFGTRNSFTYRNVSVCTQMLCPLFHSINITLADSA
jgi:hypothetical protein